MSAVSATLLIELLTEELPPKALKHLGDALAEAIASGLRARDFLSADSEVTAYATPRRLAVSITHVRAVAPDKPFREKLLPVSVAFDANGRPTLALVGKLKAKQLSHIDPASLPRASDGKSEALYYAGVAKGGPLAAALQSALDDAVARLPTPKVMSYARRGGYYNDQKFVRPAHGLIALHGAEIVPVGVLGLSAGRTTAGHRFASRPDIEIASADAYAPTLEAEGKVLPGFGERRGRIIAGLEAASGGAKIIMPDALLDEVTALVEWPKVYTGGFDPAFLEVPEECLILSMQHNQKYFALQGKDGRLQNRFLLVGNIDAHDHEPIIRGNERVLRARLADAKFFYDQDRKTRLEERVPRLGSVVYHAKLGSQLDRVQRLQQLATNIAGMLGADVALSDRAALLAKADLLTEMVSEFPDLQGTMGRYYAQHDRERPEVCTAIEQHYWPRFAGDAIPEGSVARTVAIADKLEAVVGLFGIGVVPTGDKDPFGLRRAALGVLRILADAHLPLDLRLLIEAARGAFPDSVRPLPGSVSGTLTRKGLLNSTEDRVFAFMMERLRWLLRDRGYSADEVDAVVSQDPTRIDLVTPRLDAVREFRKLPEAQSLAAANKRVRNILKQAPPNDGSGSSRVFENPAEAALFSLLDSLGPRITQHFDRHDYRAALLELAALKQPVDRFFDDVMVMVDDPGLRNSRLDLLRALSGLMNQVADISKLAV